MQSWWSRSWGRGRRRRRRRWRMRRRRRTTVIKSNNPHLAGGEFFFVEQNLTLFLEQSCLYAFPKRTKSRMKPWSKNSFSTLVQTGPWEGPIHFSRFVLRVHNCSRLFPSKPTLSSSSASSSSVLLLFLFLSLSLSFFPFLFLFLFFFLFLLLRL